MRRWVFARQPERCGYCNGDIPEGHAFLLLGDPEGQWKKKRCELHAGEPRPQNIEPVEPREPQMVSKVVPFTKLGEIKRPDIKQQQLAEADR